MNRRAKNDGNCHIFRSGDFESLSIREREISLWRSEGATWEEMLEESGEEGEQVVGSGRSGGRERRSGAEVTTVVTGKLTREVRSGGHESGHEAAHEGALEW